MTIPGLFDAIEASDGPKSDATPVPATQSPSQAADALQEAPIEPVHAWWTVSSDGARTACGLAVEYSHGGWPVIAVWQRNSVTCTDCLRTLKAAGIGL